MRAIFRNFSSLLKKLYVYENAAVSIPPNAANVNKRPIIILSQLIYGTVKRWHCSALKIKGRYPAYFSPLSSLRCLLWFALKLEVPFSTGIWKDTLSKHRWHRTHHFHICLLLQCRLQFQNCSASLLQEQQVE